MVGDRYELNVLFEAADEEPTEVTAGEVFSFSAQKCAAWDLGNRTQVL